ncbi:MAG: FixH family protein [Sulfitobacter sp.]|uniref:FixH family protein n=1 Tax=Sulfitobacter sp. TaxID=1903071 RepID=UPI004059221F
MPLEFSRLSAAIAAAIFLPAPALWAEASDYAVELVETTYRVGGDAVLTLRLTDLRDQQAVADAIIFATRLDMEPEGMAMMTSPLAPLPMEKSGEYRFSAVLSMKGSWQMSVAAKIQGEVETVSARIILEVQE